MRARNLKPTFFKNPDLADLGPVAQILFAGLWCLADKEGRLKDQPRVIKAEVFPYYDADVNGELTKLERLGFIRRYVARGTAVVEVLNFKRHQSPHHTEKASELPAYEEEKPAETAPQVIHGAVTVNPRKSNGGNPSDSLTPDSLTPDSLTPDSLTPDSGNWRAREGGGDVPHGTWEAIRVAYPPGLYRAADWLLAEREVRKRLDDGITPEALLAAAMAYGAQQQALEKVGTQYVLKPSRFFGSDDWRGPFPMPAKPETAMDRLQRMTAAPTDDRVIEHEPEFGRFIANG